MNQLTGACIIGQSGGPTAVINASAQGVIQTALKTPCITQVLGAAHGIKGVLEVLRPVSRDQAMDADDLLRAVGILLDNAIEAAAKRDGLVRVVLLQEENQLYLAIANNYDGAPNMAAIARKGYTTKGSGHGTGLSSYRRIVARCRGCAMRTYLKDGMFVQELHIPTI